jgi:hypothetical protein
VEIATRISSWFQHRCAQGDVTEFDEATQSNTLLSILIGLNNPDLAKSLDNIFPYFHDHTFAHIVWEASRSLNELSPQPEIHERSIRIPYMKLDFREDLSTALQETWMFGDNRVKSPHLLLDYIHHDARICNRKPRDMLQWFADHTFEDLVARQRHRWELLQDDHEYVVRSKLGTTASHTDVMDEDGSSRVGQPPAADDTDMTTASQQTTNERFASEATAEPGGGAG